MRKDATVNPRWYASALALGYGFYWIFHLLFIEWWFMLPHDRGPGPIVLGERITKGILVFLLIASLLALRPRRVDRTASRVRQAILLAVLLVMVGFQCTLWSHWVKSAGVMVEDVGKMTISGDRLLLRGKNPYAAEINPQVISPTVHFDGYKYLPVTLAAYFPAAMIGRDGDRGIVTTNLVFSFLAGIALAACMWRPISADAAILGAILFLLPEVIAYEELVFGSNDIVPMLLVICGLLAIECRFACGLLVGLAISAKCLPGLLWLPILLTPKGVRRYLGGAATGMAVCVPFFAWNPHAFVANAIVFIAQRPWQPSALLYPAPEVIRLLAMVAVVGFYLLIGWRMLRQETGPVCRCACAAALALALQLASPTVHQSYFIWWFMPLCVVAAEFMLSPITYEWMGGEKIFP